MFPYEKYRDSALWKKIERIIADLEDNKDIEITTDRSYVVGYFCQQLTESETE